MLNHNTYCSGSILKFTGPLNASVNIVKMPNWSALSYDHYQHHEKHIWQIMTKLDFAYTYNRHMWRDENIVVN